jgi:hypothetical protein
MRKKSMKEAEAAIEETVKKWDPAKDPHIEVRAAVSIVCPAPTHIQQLLQDSMMLSAVVLVSAALL